jgi:hypothetical protein
MDAFDRRFGLSNGIRGWIVSSRDGVLAQWTLRGVQADTSLKRITVSKGDIIDFAVDSRDDYAQDNFTWAPAIEYPREAQPRRFDAQSDFRGPRPQPLSPWEELAQVLLLTNEFAFID